MNRNARIVRTSAVGIGANVLLAAFKAAVGALSGSVAIVMDAVNNLSDALSSVVTIVGTKLAARPPDRKHPFGHGRVEYLAAIVVAALVLAAGAASLSESVRKLFRPAAPTYTAATLAVVAVAIGVKLALGSWVKRRGIALGSDALVASGADALFDALVTLATLVSAGVFLLWGVDLDGLFGVLISLLVVKAGVGMLAGPVGDLLGRGISEELLRKIRADVMAHEGVKGVYDIVLHHYGPETVLGSLHVAVPDTFDARRLHSLGREIAEEQLAKRGLLLTVGFYAAPSGALGALEKSVCAAAAAHPHVLHSHAFYLYEDTGRITLDVVTDDAVRDDAAFRRELAAALRERFPDHDFDIVVDHNYVE